MLTTDTSQVRHEHKCMIWAGRIDEERYRLGNSITNNWSGWRTDFATFLVDCIGFTPEETMNYDSYV
jgi:hypothetical protein